MRMPTALGLIDFGYQSSVHIKCAVIDPGDFLQILGKGMYTKHSTKE